jgi:hypothetical protein
MLQVMVNLMIGCVPAGFEWSPSRIQVTDVTVLSVDTMNEANFIGTVTEY